MKLKIDTEQKTITLESSENIGELIKEARKMFPDYKYYTLIVEHKVISIPYPVATPYIPYIPSYPIITYDTKEITIY